MCCGRNTACTRSIGVLNLWPAERLLSTYRDFTVSIPGTETCVNWPVPVHSRRKNAIDTKNAGEACPGSALLKKPALPLALSSSLIVPPPLDGA
jgi:hypothetical protein